MEYRFRDLVDISRLQQLADDLYVVASIPSAIISIDGEILTSSGWQRICTDFHRKHPEIAKECVASNIKTGIQKNRGEPVAILECPCGLVDTSTPILVGNEHVANVFSGQVLLDEPDKSVEQQFKAQAKRFGFDETDYMKAFREVPVFSEEQFRAGIMYLTGLAQMIGEMGLTRMRELEATKALRQSEQKARTVADFASDSEYWVDPDNNLVYQSPSIERITGYPAKKFIENHPTFFESIVHPQDKERFKNHYRRHQNSSDVVETTFRIVDKNGEIHWLENIIQSIHDDDGNYLGIRGSSRDITERKRTEDMLQQAYNIINQSPAVAFIWQNTPGWPVEFVSDNVVEIFGYTKDDFLSGGLEYMDTLHPEDLPRVRDEVDTYSRKADAVNFTHEPYRIVTKDGEERWLEDRTYVRKDDSGAVTHFEGLVIDISERIKAKQALQSSEDQLRQALKMESVGRLAGGIAHDFNNLLTTIIGYSDLISMEENLGESTRESIQEIMSSAERAASLTQQLLAFSRKQTLQFQVIDLNRLIQNLENMLERLIGEDIDLVTRSNSESTCIRADKSQIEQVLLNLVVNAKDAMPTGGVLTIDVEKSNIADEFRRKHPEIAPGDYVVLNIKDTGQGMSEETQARIYEPFFTTKEIGKGTGLGLATVYGIVKQSDGYIYVTSELNRGTTFMVLLPWVASPEENLRSTREKQQSVSGGSETILLVEDGEQLRKMATRILETFGYRVLAAESGTKALEIVSGDAHLKIDLLLTDVVMPGMSGKELSDAMSQQHPYMKVLLISGYTDDKVGHHGIVENDLPFLQKPFSPTRLAEKVREVLDAT